MKEISNAIVDIESSLELLVACGSDGTLVSWLPDLALAQKISTEQPLSSLMVQNANAICGTILGQIIVYDMKIGTMIAQVDAHVGPIHCLEIAQETNLMLSASEDTTVRVWKTNTKTPNFE
uniref:WD repeat-containing protein 54 beta-propeller domain-containing protein n=1 Tax=Romanomermis culicivorax TaxID=13658 RepID=A0A915HMN3_ROMCU